MSKQIVDVTRSEFAESFLYLKGQPFSLEYYPFLYQIYDTMANDIVLKFSRQTSKSSTLANLMVINSATIPHFQSLYISPTVDQTKVFSHDRINPVIETSPIIKDYYMNSSLVQNVFMKQFLNGSRMYLRYALLSADRIRGYSADMNMFDECQDLRADIIPVISETMSRSMYKKSLYAGTPKRTQGTLADIWNSSTMNEWAVKCQFCNHWNILGEDNIGLDAPICSKASCGRNLDPRSGQWVSTYDQTRPTPTREGYRVCILHFANAPWVDWKRDVIAKYENTKKAYFYNEVLALEYDEGASPLTMQDIVGACDPEKEMSLEMTPLERSYPCVIGIDYGPINSEESHTIITVMQQRNDIMHVLYAKRFVGKEADYHYIHNEIPKLMQHFKAQHLAADYGMGEASNSEIRSKVGFQKVIAFQHMPAQKEKVRWNPKMPAYTLNRNQVLGEFFAKVKKGKLMFPRWEDTKEFAGDIMNIQMDFDEERNTMKYVNMGPDDFVHSTVFASVALEMFYGMGM